MVKWLRVVTHAMRATTVVSLLQPAPEVFALFDDVLLLTDGCDQPARVLPACIPCGPTLRGTPQMTWQPTSFPELVWDLTHEHTMVQCVPEVQS